MICMLRGEGEAAMPGWSLGFEDSLCEDSWEPQPPGIRTIKSNADIGRPKRRRAYVGFAIAIAVVTLLACILLKVAFPWLSLKHSQHKAPLRKQSEPSSWPGKSEEQDVPWPSACIYEETPLCPAKALFENPEVHDVAAANLMRVGYNGLILRRDFSMVRAIVVASFGNISHQISKYAPAAADTLDKIPLTKIQKDAVVNSLRLMSDPRVQNIGFDVGLAIRDSPGVGRTNLKHRIEEKLRPRLEEIRKLREELMPGQLRTLWAKNYQWEMTLEPENVRVMRMQNGGKLAPVFTSLQDVYLSGTTRAPMAPAEKFYGILGGLLEEARALVDISRLCSSMFGKELDVPLWVTSLPGTHNFSSDILSCEIRTEDDNKINFMKALFCPLKFGTQGMDALRAVPDMMNSRLSLQANNLEQHEQ